MTDTEAMEHENTYACPRCDYALIPVHAVEGEERTIIALTCPEPYCDHMQMVTRQEARRIEREQRTSSNPDLRQAAQ